MAMIRSVIGLLVVISDSSYVMAASGDVRRVTQRWNVKTEETDRVQNRPNTRGIDSQPVETS